jgi:hypothetical protein
MKNFMGLKQSNSSAGQNQMKLYANDSEPDSFGFLPGEEELNTNFDPTWIFQGKNNFTLLLIFKIEFILLIVKYSEYI